MQHWKLLVVSHLAAGLVGYSIAPRELLETEVKSAGFFTTDTRRVLAVTVESLRAENKLLVFTYKGAAAVSVERTKLWLLTGRLDMIIPAQIGYYVDLSQLTLGDTHFDEQTKTLTVRVPALVLGDVAFQPEVANLKAGGVLTYNQNQVDELGRASFFAARKAFIKGAQGATLVAAAQQEAKRAVARTFQIALAAAGHPGSKVVVTFD